MTTFNTEQQQYLVEFFTAEALHNEELAQEDADMADMYLADAQQCREAATAVGTNAAVDFVRDIFSGFDTEEDLLCKIGEMDERDDIVDMLVA